jgi:uncharacterized protein (DUF433 family)
MRVPKTSENRAILDADDEVIFGKPALSGTRIAFELVLRIVADGQTIDDIMDAYPHLDREKLGRAIEAGLIARACLDGVDAESESRRLFGKPLHLGFKTEIP